MIVTKNSLHIWKQSIKFTVPLVNHPRAVQDNFTGCNLQTKNCGRLAITEK